MHLSLHTPGRIGLALFLALVGFTLGGVSHSHAQELQAFRFGNDGGSVVRLGPTDYDLSGQGRGSVSGNDQLTFVGAPRIGDFDLQVRVEDLEIVNPHVRAGLMVRATPETNSPFVAVFASSGPVGCFVEVRSGVGGTVSRASLPGGFPSVPPNTWLRVQREGNQWTSYASVDGTQWARLDSRNLELPTEVWTGLAVSSQNVGAPSRARFRGWGATTQTTELPWVHRRESATPSSRRTGLVFSEIQSHPADLADGTPGVEFIELSNHGDVFQELTGWRLTGGVEFRFPDGFRLEAGASLVVSSAPDALRPLASPVPVLGPWEGSLNNAGEAIELRDNLGAIKLQVEYSPEAPWPAAADGTGHSLVLVSPSYGEDDPRAWAPSWRRGGSPGRRDPLSAAPVEPVVINEFLAHTDLPQLDFLELFNRSTAEVDLSGWILTDDARTNRFRLPDGTRLAAGAALAFDETALGFRLSAAGETVFLLNPDATRVVDAVRFLAQENGVASGRFPDGSEHLRRLAVPTPGSLNSPRRAEDLVINEIFYNPPGGDDDQFVELHHRGTTPLNLTGWELDGGIRFRFPPGTALQPGGYLVVARNQVRLKANHPTLNPALVLGDYSGTLNHGSDVIRLTKPDELRSTNQLGVVTVETLAIPAGEVRYVDGGAWGKWADGGGSSLELVDPAADPALAASWADSDESQKAAWTTVERTARLDNGDASNGINRLYLGLLNDGECLVDDIEIRRGTSTNFLANPDFERGGANWFLGGNHARSTIGASGARNGANGLHLRAQGGLDTAINSIRGQLGTGLAANQTITFRASVRWIAGWPELLFRLRGNFAEFAAPLPVPTNLGTPGAVNSRRIPNAGPAVYDVTHVPALPRVNEPVLITARASDPEAVARLVVQHRTDPSTNLTEVVMRDDGLEGDALAGDGLYTARLDGRGTGSLVAFTLAATDGSGATSVWPRNAPADEALIRWGDPAPFGSFPHVHLWATSANRTASGGALNNAYRRCTLVYGNTRVIYHSVFRDKGSPFHNGSGDLTARTPDDEKLHGVSERIFAKTGNGGVEETALRGRVAAWLASEMGVPSLSGKYQFLFVNGSSFANVVEDLEEPDHRYAEHHQPDQGEGDLYKISIWFEFTDSNTQFSATQATLDAFSSEGQLKLARYRWNWERRAQEFPESNYQTIFDLVNLMNSTPNADYVARVQQQVDMEQWMAVFAFHRVTGNWDSWTYNVGQNMYLYRQPGRRAVLLPWDIDFLFGLGDPTSANLWGGQDGVMNTRVYDNPTFRRMLWRALARAADGPMLPQRYLPVVEAYRAAQIQNNVSGLGSLVPVTNYLNGRRTIIQSRYRAADAASFTITSNGGADFTSATPTVTLTGTAPFRVAEVAVNGVRLPVNWTDFTTFSIQVPLTAATNDLRLVGLDREGRPLADSDTIRVVYPGAIPVARDWVVLNEIHYHPAEPGTSFIELYNRHPSVPFNLAGFRLDGVGYTFPPTANLPANGYLILAANRADFATRYGVGVPVFDEFTGSLDNDGERLRLLPPGSTQAFSEVRYLDRAPWPTNADGFGPSLQLLDPAQDTRRPANWAVTATNAANRVTPGAINATRTTLPAFPGVWLNEVFPRASEGILDNAGEAEPFVELHNSGTGTADLSGVGLSDAFANPNRWTFPAGTQVAPGGFLRVWLDNEPGETAPGHLHAGFRPTGGSGLIVLSRSQGTPAAPTVLDWIDDSQLPPGRGYGSIPDGSPFTRRPLYRATPAAPNDPFVPTVEVVINEFLAQNTSGLADPADNDFDDWLELYNPGNAPADLSGYFLTDNLTNRTASVLPPGTVIPAGGFLLIWADNEPQQTDVTQGRFHTRFNLSRTGEEVGLFGPDGSLVDGTSFGEQTANRSWGRYPDGPDGEWIALDGPTPAEPNFVPGGNLPPRFTVLPPPVIPEQVRWTLRLLATDPDPGQTIHYSLGAEAPAGVELQAETGELSWTPEETQGPGAFTVVVRATDNGTPPRSSTLRLPVQVTEANRPPVLAELPESTVGEGSLFTLNLTGTDPDLPAQALTFALLASLPEGMQVDPASGRISWIPSEVQGPGSYDVTAQVTDSGSPEARATRVFRVVVEERDNPPVITQPDPQILDEATPLVMTLKAADPDGAPVRFALQTDAPPGLTLDEVTGVIRWTPTEEQGPGSYPLIVQVTEQSPLAQTAQATFSILVREANQPPRLALLPALVRFEDDRIELTAKATDSDLPLQNLFYSLENSVPGTATLDPQTGLLRWRLPVDFGETNLTLQVRVSDDAFPPQSALRELQVRLLPRFRVVLAELMNRPLVSGSAYIELFNPSRVTAWNLSGVRLSGRQFSFSFPEGTVLQPGARVCVVGDLVRFRAAYGEGIAVAGQWTGSIGSDGDDLRLQAVTGELLDRVLFTSEAPWPVQPAGGGVALQLIDPWADNSRPGNWAAVTAFDGPRQPVTYTSTWRYLETGAPPADWTALAFDDRGWKLGAGLLFNESAPLPAPKTTPLGLGQISYQFRTRFVLPAVPADATLALSHLIDDGAVFYLNGQELTRFNFTPNTAVTPTRFADVGVGDAALVGPVTLPATLLRSGTNVLAVSVHQNNLGSSDIVFGAQLGLVGGTLPGFTPGAANNVDARLPEFPDLFLNEFSPVAGVLKDAAGEAEPWVELLNAGSEAVPLAGWTLSASGAAVTWSFPAASPSLQPGERRVVFLDGEPGESTVAELHASFRPSPTGGWIALGRPVNVGSGIVDFLNYGAPVTDRTFSAVPEGQSFARLWLRPTPGLANPVATILAPRLGARVSAAGLVVGWNGAEGVRYRLESADAVDGAWLPVDRVTGNGAALEVLDLAQPTETRFYRVVVE